MLLVVLCLMIAGSGVQGVEAATGAAASVTYSTTHRVLNGTFTCTSPVDHQAGDFYTSIVMEFYVGGIQKETSEIFFSPPNQGYVSSGETYTHNADFTSTTSVYTKTTCKWIRGGVTQTPKVATSQSVT